MTVKEYVCIVALLLSSGSLMAQPNACKRPFADFHHLSADELRSISDQCHDDGVAYLFMNRAYHKELLAELKGLGKLQSTTGENATRHYHTHRIYIGMSEALATEAWFKGHLRVIDVLNDSYDQALDLAEYQIKGNDLLVHRDTPSDLVIPGNNQPPPQLNLLP